MELNSSEHTNPGERQKKYAIRMKRRTRPDEKYRMGLIEGFGEKE
jgi:hypothetical protein